MTILEWILIGIILVLLYINGTNKKEKGVKFKIIPPKVPVKDGHLAPIYYRYSGGYTRLNKCENNEFCGIIGLYEDMHQVDPCPNCGSEVNNYQAGYWGEIDGEKQWITKMQHEKIQAESNTK